MSKTTAEELKTQVLKLNEEISGLTKDKNKVSELLTIS